MADKPKVAGYRKFRNVPTEVDGIRFASKREAARYSELRVLANARKITGFVYLKKMLRWDMVVNGIKICTYEADFSYVNDEGGQVEDCKGMRTPVYKLKKKLMKALYGIEIKEI